METIKGYVEHIIYRNTENGWTVLNLYVDGEEITCVGSLPLLSEGEMIEAEGSYTVHSSYGQQFKIETYTEVAPEDAVAMERYLGSGAIKGVGSALAARIVRRFKADTFRIMEEEPERLAEIKGISERKAREIAEQVAEKKEMREAMLFLSHYGISNNLALKIYQRYTGRLYTVIRENPYRMADEVDGIGFHVADEIARKAGIQVDSDFRIRSGIFYVLQQATGEGHMYLPADLVKERTGQLLDINLNRVEDYLRDLAVEKKIVVKQEEGEMRVYTSSVYRTELRTAQMLHDLNVKTSVNRDQIKASIAQIEKQTGTKLDEKQQEAVISAVGCGLMVLTGGPGTGKTTTINTMIAYFEQEGLQIELAAPTGRAAKRMSEATGCEARTVHRLLEVAGGPDEKVSVFGRDASNPIEADVIIIDEMSMIDIFLMHALLQAVTIGTRLIMVGDTNQLPSVGPGSVLKDIIASGICTVVCLERIFRQAAESDIVMNAHQINDGKHPVLDNKSKDFFFLQRQDMNQILKVTLELVAEKMPAYVQADKNEIQVLTPSRKGNLGSPALNKFLQEYLNPKDPMKEEIEQKERVLRVGDKVMQIRNNYQAEWEIRGRYGMPVDKGTGVFNGDCGIITEINTYEETLTVEFEDHHVISYPFGSLDELEHAYAITIHKSQGSEYPAVVIPLLSGPRMLLNRNLIYTAVTRAKKCVVIVGDPQVFDQMIDNTSVQRRYTTLKTRLQELYRVNGEEPAIE